MQWQDQVASYHALYGPSTLADVSQTEPQANKELARVASAIGKSIPLEILQTAPGLSYRRAQLSQFKGQPLVQLSFTTANAVPLALCIMRSSAEAKYELQTETLQGLATVRWSEGGYAYVLIGGTHQAALKTLADHFRSNV
jgi:anti-sigma factor RsiW